MCSAHSLIMANICAKSFENSSIPPRDDVIQGGHAFAIGKQTDGQTSSKNMCSSMQGRHNYTGINNYLLFLHILYIVHTCNISHFNWPHILALLKSSKKRFLSVPKRRISTRLVKAFEYLQLSKQKNQR